jgi:hypothetical protein
MLATIGYDHIKYGKLVGLYKIMEITKPIKHETKEHDNK